MTSYDPLLVPRSRKPSSHSRPFAGTSPFPPVQASIRGVPCSFARSPIQDQKNVRPITAYYGLVRPKNVKTCLQFALSCLSLFVAIVGEFTFASIRVHSRPFAGTIPFP